VFICVCVSLYIDNLIGSCVCARVNHHDCDTLHAYRRTTRTRTTALQPRRPQPVRSNVCACGSVHVCEKESLSHCIYMLSFSRINTRFTSPTHIHTHVHTPMPSHCLSIVYTYHTREHIHNTLSPTDVRVYEYSDLLRFTSTSERLRLRKEKRRAREKKRADMVCACVFICIYVLSCMIILIQTYTFNAIRSCL
jgi:hypothetical protein